MDKSGNGSKAKRFIHSAPFYQSTPRFSISNNGNKMNAK